MTQKQIYENTDPNNFWGGYSVEVGDLKFEQNPNYKTDNVMIITPSGSISERLTANTRLEFSRVVRTYIKTSSKNNIEKSIVGNSGIIDLRSTLPLPGTSGKFGYFDPNNGFFMEWDNRGRISVVCVKDKKEYRQTMGDFINNCK